MGMFPTGKFAVGSIPRDGHQPPLWWIEEAVLHAQRHISKSSVVLRLAKPHERLAIEPHFEPIGQTSAESRLHGQSALRGTVCQAGRRIFKAKLNLQGTD